MPRSYRAALAGHVRQAEVELTKLLRDVATRLGALVLRHAGADGTIPRHAAPALQRAVADAVDGFFLGVDRRGRPAPLETRPDGSVEPLSPYVRVLWAAIEGVVREAVEREAAAMRRRLPPDIVALFEQATAPPFRVAEVFRPNPRAVYEPPHRWVDPNGYTLSDRIWNADAAMRARLDAFLEDSIRRGHGARRMARELEQFLVPGRSLRRTLRPYGTDASYDAMRLMRTEITHAAGAAAIESARLNPAVGGMRWRRTSGGRPCEICDPLANGGPDGDGVYPLDAIPNYPGHPHCMCSLLPQTLPPDKLEAVLAQVRADVRRERADLVQRVGPLQVEQFTDLLLGNPLRVVRPSAPGVTVAPVPVTLPRIARVVAPAVAPAPVAAAQPATSPELLGDEVVFRKGDAPNLGARLNGVPFDDRPAPEWGAIADSKGFVEPVFDAAGKRASSGVILVEPDGRIWIVEPTNHYGGYQNTFPKGGVARGLTMQQSALKEVWEESGLVAEIDGFLLDAVGDTSVTRYYVGRRVGGNPWAMGWESQAVKLVTLDRAEGLLNVARDRNTLAALRGYLQPPVAPPVIPPPVPPAPLPPVSAPAVAGGFPATLDELEFVRDLGGSTGARLMRERATGKLFVMKRGRDAGHLREEILADRAYQALGVNVPRLQVYETDQGPVKLAEFIEGRMLGELRTSNRAAYEAALKKLRGDFAADALLGNWDVLGMGFDNILVDKGGKVWRIDNGGALRRRAQGALKQNWGRYVDEFWTLRNARVNQQTAAAFGELGYFEVVKQMRRLGKRRAAVLDVLPADLRDLMAARFEVMDDLAKMAATLQKDNWVEGYIDDFARHSVGLRKAGIVDRLPRKLDNRGVFVYDERGKEWDDLRADPRGGGRSIMHELEAYLQANGGDYGAVRHWAEKQAGDSWSSGPQAAKYFLTSQRADDVEATFWWKQGRDEARRHYEAAIRVVGEERFRETWTAWHAFNYEFVRTVQFKHNNLRRGAIKLMRTESMDVMKLHNMSRGQIKVMRRGALESTSIFEPVTVYGRELTTQWVPHHRVFGNYMLERMPGTSTSMFLGNRENEFVAMLEGLQADYRGTIWR